MEVKQGLLESTLLLMRVLLPEVLAIESGYMPSATKLHLLNIVCSIHVVNVICTLLRMCFFLDLKCSIHVVIKDTSYPCKLAFS